MRLEQHLSAANGAQVSPGHVRSQPPVDALRVERVRAGQPPQVLAGP
eukprot:CAMPEP_0168500728 /NCGR_PEP_ID=MMETSP0228-20121227/74439_1 /TAXON_ID=133427 /ORGANISM="Protoceratium reticulatum, Strain CCCM 535 (=CCMP 1889)" /LENGTH=46 /DNA_ID= /DNA_START= /DNA_END= /DNA_ORIENTATION=